MLHDQNQAMVYLSFCLVMLIWPIGPSELMLYYFKIHVSSLYLLEGLC